MRTAESRDANPSTAVPNPREHEQAPIWTRRSFRLTGQQLRRLRRAAARLAPLAEEAEAGWRRRLRRALGYHPDSRTLRALAALNPGGWTPLLSAGKVEEFLEIVEYNARRLAKFDFPPEQALQAVECYGRSLAALRRSAPSSWRAGDIEAFEQLALGLRLTLTSAYFDVRDAETRSLYRVVEEQVAASGAEDAVRRLLATLRETFAADAAMLLETNAEHGVLQSVFSLGVERPLARDLSSRLRRLAAEAVRRDLVESAILRGDGAADAVSVWVAPLGVTGASLGALALLFRREYQCFPRERKLFGALAERCARAIEKTRLEEDLIEREQRIRSLNGTIVRVEDEERRRISRELHDEVGQALLVARLSLEVAESQLDFEAAGRERVIHARRVIEGAIDEMRRLISALSPSVLEQLGLAASVRQYVRNLGRSFAGDIRVRLSGLESLPRPLEAAAYRLIQECLANAVKHSQAERVVLLVRRQNGTLRLRLRDDGVGFDPARLEESTRFGLRGMRERVALLGGRFELRSAPGAGVKVAIAIPVPRPELN